MDLSSLSATDSLVLLERKQVSSEELVGAFADRTNVVDLHLNAVITRDCEQSLRQARSADDVRIGAGNSARNGGSFGILTGLPLTVKDSFEIAGWRTTSGSERFSDHIGSTDAVMVSRVRSAGAVVIGRTNVPEFCGDIVTDNAVFGRTNNPHDVTRTPGGSSGGAAAAVAAGLSPVEIGSDFGGSIRLPAAYCGVLGHRCTELLAPLRGQIPGPPGTLREVPMATGGFLARTAADLRLLLRAAGGPDTEMLNLPRFELPTVPSRTLRAGLFADPNWAPLDDKVSTRTNDLVQKLGGTFDFIDFTMPFTLDEVKSAFMAILLAQTGAAYDDATFAAFHDDDGLRTLGFTSTFRDYAQQQEVVLQLRRRFAEACREVDVVMLPVVAGVAPVHQSGTILERTIEVNGSTIPATTQFDWISIASVLDLPASVAPIGFEYAMPVGVQIVSLPFRDEWTISAAESVARVCGFDLTALTTSTHFTGCS